MGPRRVRTARPRVPPAVDAVYPDDEALAAAASAGDQLTAALRAIAAHKVVVVFDCCHAGGVGRPKDPTRLSMLTAVDLTRPDRVNRELARLVTTLSSTGA